MVDETTAPLDINALGESDLENLKIDDETGALTIAEPSPKDGDGKPPGAPAAEEEPKAGEKPPQEEKPPEKGAKKPDEGEKPPESEVKKPEEGEKAEEGKPLAEEKPKDEELTLDQKAEKRVNDARKQMHLEISRRQEAERKLDAVEHAEKAKQLEALDKSGLDADALEELKTDDPDGYIALMQKQKPERVKVEQEIQDHHDLMQTREVCNFLLKTTGIDIQAISRAEGVEAGNAKLKELAQDSEDFVKVYKQVQESGIYKANSLNVYETETFMAAHNQIFHDRIVSEQVEQAREQARKDAFAAHENAGNSGSRISRGGPSIPGDHGEHKKAKDYTVDEVNAMGIKEFAAYEALADEEEELD